MRDWCHWRVSKRRRSDDLTGKGPQAVQIYQQLADKPTLFVPKPVALLALADHYTSSDPDQAAKFYRQVKTEFPDTPAATTADQRLAIAPHQELSGPSQARFCGIHLLSNSSR